LEIEMEKGYQNFQFQYNDDTFKKVEERWGKYIRKWNYKATDDGL